MKIKKIVTALLTLSLCVAPLNSLAISKDFVVVEPETKIGDIGSQIEVNNMREYESFEYNGVDEVYLGEFKEQTLLKSYREYDTYKVYDQGITSKWNWLSNPYFIISIAKGASYESSRTITATISGNISGSFPSGAEKSIFNAFGISASGSKTVSERVYFSGPTGSARTRDFYYQKGTHKHSVKVVQEHRSNWDGLLWTRTYYISVNVPAIRSYSEDY